MLFQIVKVEFDAHDTIAARRTTQPLFELESDAVALAEFDAARIGDDYGFDPARNCWWSIDACGRRVEFVVEALLNQAA